MTKLNRQNTTINELSLAIKNAHGYLVNNQLDEFIELFSEINTYFVKTDEDNATIVTLIDQINELNALVELKHAELAQNIKNARVHLKATRTYQSPY